MIALVAVEYRRFSIDGSELVAPDARALRGTKRNGAVQHDCIRVEPTLEAADGLINRPSVRQVATGGGRQPTPSMRQRDFNSLVH